jgi:hypothetical protein
MPRFVFGSRKKEEDLSKREELIAPPVPPVDVKKDVKQEEVQEPAKIQLVTPEQLTQFKLDRIIEILESSMEE